MITTTTTPVICLLKLVFVSVLKLTIYFYLLLRIQPKF